MNPLSKIIAEQEKLKELLDKMFPSGLEMHLTDMDSRSMRQRFEDLFSSSHIALLEGVIEMVGKMRCDERKTKDFGECTAKTYDEKMLVNSTLSDLRTLLEQAIKEVTK